MERKKGIFFGLLAGALWGADGVLMGIYFDKLLIAEGISILVIPIIVACMHDGLAALWIFLKNLASGKSYLYKQILRSKASIPLILGSILGGPVGMTGNLLGIQLAGASYTSAITASYPVLGAVLGMIFLKEKVTPIGFVGIILAVLGAVTVGYNPPDGGSSIYFYIGIICSILAVVGWALEGVISTYCMKDIDSDIVIGIRELSSGITYLIIIVILIILGHKFLISYVNYQYLWVIVLASIIGAFSYLCWYRSMKSLGVSIAMSLNITYALWSVLFSCILVGLKLTSTLMIGVVIITLGTILTIRGMKNKNNG
jgi:drug/metabolite transporter (DMT)-like permease